MEKYTKSNGFQNFVFEVESKGDGRVYGWLYSGSSGVRHFLTDEELLSWTQF